MYSAVTAQPRTLALVDDDADYCKHLAAFLRRQGMEVHEFQASETLLVHTQPYDFDFYIFDLLMPGIDGLSLLRVLRLRSNAGVLVVSGKVAADVFDSVMAAGADMHLAKPVTFEQVALAVSAVYRRSGRASAPASGPLPKWQLDALQARLLAPDGTVIELSPTDLCVLNCLHEAGGTTVSREALAAYLGLVDNDDSNLLNATIYRLRRRIERATQALAPLQAKSRAGYVFRAPLTKI